MNDRRCFFKATWFLLFVLAGTGVIKAESRWIRQVPKNRGVIIFVHGLTGDATSTWTSSSRKYWPDMLTQDSAFDGQGIYVYEYVSPKMTGALSLSQLTDEMYDRLKTDGVLTHDELTFVSHSMGGILTREFLVRYQNVTANKTRMLLFLATPMTGSEFSKLGRFSFNPQFTILVPNDDPDSFLNTLQDNWKDLHLASKSYCAYETKTSWLGQVVVEKTSAVMLCDSYRAISADHKTIAKPTDANSPSYIYFKTSFLESAPLPKVSTSPQQPKIASQGPKSVSPKPLASKPAPPPPLVSVQPNSPTVPVAPPESVRNNSCPPLGTLATGWELKGMYYASGHKLTLNWNGSLVSEFVRPTLDELLRQPLCVSSLKETDGVTEENMEGLYSNIHEFAPKPPPAERTPYGTVDGQEIEIIERDFNTSDIAWGYNFTNKNAVAVNQKPIPISKLSPEAAKMLNRMDAFVKGRVDQTCQDAVHGISRP